MAKDKDEVIVRDGKRYHRLSGTMGKAGAHKVVKNLVAQGNRARTVKVKGGHAVYVGEKRKQK